MPSRAQFSQLTSAGAPLAPPCTLHTIRYGSVPFERARDHTHPPPPCREIPSNAHPIVTPRYASLAIPVLYHIYILLFTGELGGRGKRRSSVVGGGGGVAERRGGHRRADSGHFYGRNVIDQKSGRWRRFARSVRAPRGQACAHVFSPSLKCILVCVLCVCGSVFSSPIHPLPPTLDAHVRLLMAALSAPH